MRNPDNPIKAIDERPKSKEEVAEMIDKMFKNDEDGYPEHEKTDKRTA